jgi:hypothetical protein
MIICEKYPIQSVKVHPVSLILVFCHLNALMSLSGNFNAPVALTKPTLESGRRERIRIASLMGGRAPDRDT